MRIAKYIEPDLVQEVPKLNMTRQREGVGGNSIQNNLFYYIRIYFIVTILCYFLLNIAYEHYQREATGLGGPV